MALLSVYVSRKVAASQLSEIVTMTASMGAPVSTVILMRTCVPAAGTKLSFHYYDGPMASVI